MAFFESLRTALGRYATGVHEAAAPASEETLARAERRLERRLPAAYRDFLLSWNGVALFHEAYTLLPIDEVEAGRGPFLIIGETPEGGLWLDGDGAIYLVDEAAPDPLLAGTGLGRFLDALLAREALVLDRDGEFRDVFTDDEEAVLLPEVRRKRARLGQKHDPGATLYALEQAELLCEEGEDPEARQLLEQATGPLGAHALGGGPAWELLAALRRQQGDTAGAEAAALKAADATWDPFLRASRLLDAAEAAAARAQAGGGDGAAAAHAQAAWRADDEHAERLLTEAKRLLGEGAVDEARRLVERLRLLCRAEQDRPEQAGLERLERELRTRDALRLV
ncbi:MAG: SMI1/KNR4 family protein [Polyangia bacterium]